MTEAQMLREALEEIFDMTRRKQLPLTSAIHDIARQALAATRDDKPA